MDDRTFPYPSRRTLGANVLGAGEPTTFTLSAPILAATIRVLLQQTPGVGSLSARN